MSSFEFSFWKLGRHLVMVFMVAYLINLTLHYGVEHAPAPNPMLPVVALTTVLSTPILLLHAK